MCEEMTDSEMWRAVRDQSQEKRANNREFSAKLLRDNSINFESKNNGAHLIIDNKVDFWPGTGKWIVRNGRKGRGVKNLMKWIKENAT